MSVQDFRKVLENTSDKFSVISSKESIISYNVTISEYLDLIKEYLSDKEKLKLFGVQDIGKLIAKLRNN